MVNREKRMRQFFIVFIAILTCGASNVASAAVINHSHVFPQPGGSSCNSAVKSAHTTSTTLLHIIILTSQHWYVKQNNVSTGVHYVFDNASRALFLQVADIFPNNLNPKSLHLRTIHEYTKCMPGGPVQEYYKLSKADYTCP